MVKAAATAIPEPVAPRRLRVLFTIGACYDLWIVGLVITTLGPLVPSLMRHFSLTPAAVAVIFTARGIGYLLAVVAGGLAADLYGRKLVIVSGALLTGGSLLLSTLVQSWQVVVALATATGAGQGLIDGVSNVIVTDMHSRNPGRALNFLHVWFGVGAFCGPLLAGGILDRGGTWADVFEVVGIAALGLAGLFAPFGYPKRPVSTKQREDTRTNGSLQTTFRELSRAPLFLIVASVMFLYNGVAGSIIGWVNTYLESLFGFTTISASLTLSMYSAGILVGRLLMGVVVERVGYGLALLVCSVGSFLSITLAVASPFGFLAAAGFTLTGLFFSALFPTALAVGGTLFPGMMGVVSGSLVGAAALGSMVVPWLTGVLVDWLGMKAAMFTNAALLAVLAVSGIQAHRALRQRTKDDAAAAD